MLYNKDLYTKAGLDPEKPPTTLHGVRRPRPQGRQARRRHQRHLLRRQLRRLHRVHPVAVGLGGGRRRDERRRHRRRRSTSKEMAERLRALPQAVRRGRRGARRRRTRPARPGSARCRAARSASRPGRRPGSAIIEEKGVKVGVAPITGLNGGESTFVGGDVDRHRRHQQARPPRPGTSWPGPSATRRRSRSSRRARACRSAPTCAANKYSSADPRIVTHQQPDGARARPRTRRTSTPPSTTRRARGCAACRGALFGDAAARRSTTATPPSPQSLQEVSCGPGPPRRTRRPGHRPAASRRSLMTVLAPPPTDASCRSGAGRDGARAGSWSAPLYAAPDGVHGGLFFVVPLGLVGWMSLHRLAAARRADAQRAGQLRRASPTTSCCASAVWFTAEVHGHHHGRCCSRSRSGWR